MILAKEGSCNFAEGLGIKLVGQSRDATGGWDGGRLDKMLHMPAAEGFLALVLLRLPDRDLSPLMIP